MGRHAIQGRHGGVPAPRLRLLGQARGVRRAPQPGGVGGGAAGAAAGDAGAADGPDVLAVHQGPADAAQDRPEPGPAQRGGPADALPPEDGPARRDQAAGRGGLRRGRRRPLAGARGPRRRRLRLPLPRRPAAGQLSPARLRHRLRRRGWQADRLHLRPHRPEHGGPGHQDHHLHRGGAALAAADPRLQQQREAVRQLRPRHDPAARADGKCRPPSFSSSSCSPNFSLIFPFFFFVFLSCFQFNQPS